MPLRTCWGLKSAYTNAELKKFNYEECHLFLALLLKVHDGGVLA